MTPPSETDSEPAAAFIALLSRHEPVIRAYLRTLLPGASDVDALMPDVALVAWRKFPTLEDHDAFPQWACVIARYEVLRFRRDQARDRLVLDEDVILKLANEAESACSLRERQMVALEQCLGKLPAERRELLLGCYAPGATMRAVAQRIGRNEDAIYQLVHRLRSELARCVENLIQKENAV